MTLQDVMELANLNYSDLPPGWTKSAIKELIGHDGIFCDGDWVESKDQDPNGEVRLIQLADIGDGFFKDQSDRFLTFKKSIELNCTYLQKGDILVARLPDPLGRACIFPLSGIKKFVTVVDVCIIRNNSNFINSQYLLYLINSPQTRLEVDKYKSGSTRKRISRKNFAKIQFPIAPLPEQHRIVEKIEELFSELDNGVASLKKVLEQLKTYRQAVLKWAFEGKLTEKWRNTHQDSLEDADTLLEQIKAERKRHYQQQLEDWKQALKEWENNGKETKKPIKPQQPKDLPPLTKEELSNLPSLPDGWMWVKVDYLLSLDKKGMTTGPFGTLLKKSEHQISGIPVLGIENIGNGVFLPKNKIFITEKKARELSSFEVSGGDIIISRSGTVGEICLVPDYFGYSLISTNLIRISLNKNIIIPKFFVFLFLGGGSVREQVKELCKGSTRDFLNQTILQTIIFPFPSLQEQTQIVQEIESRLSVCDQLEATLTENLDKAEALRQSILKRAFEGKLVL
ncbi:MULTISPECIES: restriction endonuclease subunit S [Microcystis]|uniref:HsdS protein n=2 Tax=Microcystis aeruginosa (strain PCC 7806) TaxID=267872 RepID=A8YCA1_MICA7|nr:MULTISPECIES: restriction endonuclease subunit S [Microcystis]TRU00430.1 MAG: restriction endonuclease subunit S [Microcystis aeruginosa Ma_AC_P_19900807_S300]ARI80239.1 HsdS [Microcystis aeruginosa PCC 7806SL]ELS48273.1 type I restriction modification DNA specificity domain protein [Microcystis aeruginosa FACHB-905 = DIANCHI905]UGS08198.1 restriction endonuclease subunit S [Microcystis aeruginosa FACHB-905 = DIANCHI905]WKX63484.1 restriction endonuclease subunit S [Microcystis aeruginosa P